MSLNDPDFNLKKTVAGELSFGEKSFGHVALDKLLWRCRTVCRFCRSSTSFFSWWPPVPGSGAFLSPTMSGSTSGSSVPVCRGDPFIFVTSGFVSFAWLLLLEKRNKKMIFCQKQIDGWVLSRTGQRYFSFNDISLK